MTCDRCQSLVGEYVDGTLDAGEREAVEAHLASCAACRTMAADLGAIRDTARTLEPHVPPPHVWTTLSAAIDGERRHEGGARRLPGRLTWRPLAIAATLVLVAGGSSWLLLRGQPGSAPASRPAATTGAGRADAEIAHSVETELKLAEEHYQKAIAGLEQITRSERGTLDPQVAAVLQKNLEVIDHAIGESRAALQTQPTSEVAQQSLFEALRSKVSLLQDTVVLINEMRKGNPEGTARAVSGLNQ